MILFLSLFVFVLGVECVCHIHLALQGIRMLGTKHFLLD